jgi:hypothetical protein
MDPLSTNLHRPVRSPEKALADLVDKLDRVACRDPELPMLARMIRQLSEEIAVRSSLKALLKSRAAEAAAELGLY